MCSMMQMAECVPVPYKEFILFCLRNIILFCCSAQWTVCSSYSKIPLAFRFGVVPIVQFSSKTKSCASLQRVYKKQ